MHKSTSLSNASRWNKQSADKVWRRHLAEKPTPAEMLIWIEGVKMGHSLVLVKKPGRDDDRYVKAFAREFTDLLDLGPDTRTKTRSETETRSETKSLAPKGSNRFRTLMKNMLSDAQNVPPQLKSAAQPLEDILASEEVKTYGVVRTEGLLRALRQLNAAIEAHRQAQQDQKGVGLEEAQTPVRRPRDRSKGATKPTPVPEKKSPKPDASKGDTSVPLVRTVPKVRRGRSLVLRQSLVRGGAPQEPLSTPQSHARLSLEDQPPE